jgi:hypothetical protein
MDPLGAVQCIFLIILLIISALIVNVLQLLAHTLLFPFASRRVRLGLSQRLANAWFASPIAP